MRIAAAKRGAIVGISATFLVTVSPAVEGEIIVDGSLGPRTTLTGPSFAVTADFGRRVGANLLHSFSRFNIANGESATFSGPASVANIIGRVTGGSASQIDGLLRSTIAGANLYLINPKGIAFGPNASLDVSGSFHAGSADYVKFADGARFDAANPQASTFTSASPTAFGFLGANPAGIAVNGAFLSVPTGRTLSLVGGDIQLSNATLSALSGRVNVASVASAGELALDALGITPLPVSKFGSVIFSNSSIETDSAGGKAAGAIDIRGGRFVLENSSLLSTNAATDPGGPIEAVLADEIAIDGGTVNTASIGAGDAGAIRLEAPVISLDNGGKIHSTASVGGAGGAVTVAASTLSLDRGSKIMTATTGSGAGGAIAITANERITVSADESQIASVSFPGSSGDAGPISIKAPAIAVTDGAGIASDTGGAGNGGAVSIDTGVLHLDRDGSVSAITEGAGHGGSIDISAGSIRIAGGKAYPSGQPDKAIPEITYFGYYSGLYATSQSSATGKAGEIRIKANTLRISDGGTISGVTLGAGDAGNFDIQAGDISLEGGGLIHTSTSGAGAAGSISLTANEFIRASGRLDVAKYTGFAPRGSPSSGIVSKSTLDLNPTSPLLGNAGSIAAAAPLVWLADDAEISTSAAKNAIGGTIAVTAGSMEIARGASVSSESHGTGNAGNIAIRSTNALRILEGGSVTTEARSADGGDIDIRTTELVQLAGSRITTSVGTGAGNGGNIFIDPQFVVLNNSRIIANAYGGNGGNIRIAAQNYLSSPDSVVEASSQLGIAGTIQITSPNSDVGAGLAILPANFFDASTMLRQSCAMRSTGSVSSLVAVGRGGLPVSPEGYLPLFADPRALGARSETTWQRADPAAGARRVRNLPGIPSQISSKQALSPCGS